MSLFDQILRSLAIMDVSTPTAALIRGGTAIRIPREGSPSGRALERKLKRAGVKVRHVMVDPIRNEIRIAVDDKDARIAWQIIEGREIPHRHAPKETTSSIAPEWTCEYCGRRNPGWVYQCQGCGHQ